MRWQGLSSMALAAWAAGACSVETDSEVRGSCSLSCTEPKVPAGEYEVVPLMPDDSTDIELFCTAPFRAENNSILPYNKPLQVKYYIYELVPPFGKRPLDPREDPDGAAAPNDEDDVPGLMERVPKSGVGFEPVIFGAMATEKTNPEHYDGSTVSSGKFDGVVTPKNEWCSDTCGVMTYEFWPVCIEGSDNSIVAGLAAGGAFVKKNWKFTITNDDSGE